MYPFTRDDLKNADMTVAAYVTFENVSSRRRAEKLFVNRRRCCGCFSSYSKKLRGTHRLRAKFHHHHLQFCGKICNTLTESVCVEENDIKPRRYVDVFEKIDSFDVW